MDLNLFGEESSSDIKSVIQGTDADKFQKIANALCVKRKALEDKLTMPAHAGNDDTNATDEERLELRDLIEEMRTFGVGEIEYAKWLVVEAKEAVS